MKNTTFHCNTLIFSSIYLLDSEQSKLIRCTIILFSSEDIFSGENSASIFIFNSPGKFLVANGM